MKPKTMKKMTKTCPACFVEEHGCMEEEKMCSLHGSAALMYEALQWAWDMVEGGYICPPLDNYPMAKFRAGVKDLKAALRAAKGGKP